MARKRMLRANAAASGAVSVLDAFDEYIYQKEAENKSEKTIRNYIQSFGILSTYYHWDRTTEFDEVNEKTFYQWIQAMKKNDTRASSINHYLRDCRTFFNWAIDKEYMLPLDSKFKWKIEEQEELPKLYTDFELELLLEKPNRGKNASATDWRIWTIVNLILSCGLRADTVINLRTNDVDFAKEEIYIRKTKAKKAYIVPLSPSCALALREYIKMWRSGEHATEWLFPDITESKMSYNALRLSYERYCKNRGVENTSIHSLRHNFAKGFIRNGGNPLMLQKILGHSTLTMTKHYVNLFSEDLKEGYADFSPLDVMKKKYKRTKKLERS